MTIQDAYDELDSKGIDKVLICPKCKDLFGISENHICPIDLLDP